MTRHRPLLAPSDAPPEELVFPELADSAPEFRDPWPESGSEPHPREALRRRALGARLARILAQRPCPDLDALAASLVDAGADPSAEVFSEFNDGSWGAVSAAFACSSQGAHWPLTVRALSLAAPAWTRSSPEASAWALLCGRPEWALGAFFERGSFAKAWSYCRLSASRGDELRARWLESAQACPKDAPALAWLPADALGFFEMALLLEASKAGTAGSSEAGRL